MNFSNGIINEEDKFNNIIYYDSNAEKYKKEIHNDSDTFERVTPGAFILCTNLDSLGIIRDEILRHRRSEKKTIFNIISNGRGYIKDLKPFLNNNPRFKECLNKLCIYCFKPSAYEQEKKNDPNFIKEFSSKDIKPFPLTKLVTLSDYQDKYNKDIRQYHCFMEI